MSDDEFIPISVVVMPAELVGMAEAPGGVLNIGGVEIKAVQRLLQRDDQADEGKVAVYVRRLSSDLAVAQILMSGDDSLAMEALGAQNDIVDSDRDPAALGDEVEDIMSGVATGSMAVLVQEHAALVAKWAGVWAEDKSFDVQMAFGRIGALLDEACEVLAELGRSRDT